MKQTILRIDKFFKLSRIIKRRTEAKKACENHCVRLNGRTAKAGDLIKLHDHIEVHFRNRILEIEVMEIPEGNVSVPRSTQLYNVIKDEKTETV